jgi:CRP-like cAMP-binding protein
MAAGSDKNLILASLAPATRAALESLMTVHNGVLGDILQREDTPIEAVWFPLSGLVSTVRTLEGDANVEVDAAGADGFLGIELLLGGTTSSDCWMVQSPGRFGRINARTFADMLTREAGLRHAMTAYARNVIAMRGQWVACNARHTVEQRLAKWLLLTRDRVGDEIAITQDMVAMMLGVRRASVVTALGRFVGEGTVAHGYAKLRVLDDASLRQTACPCYAKAADVLFAGSRQEANGVAQASKLG